MDETSDGACLPAWRCASICFVELVLLLGNCRCCWGGRCTAQALCRLQVGQILVIVVRVQLSPAAHHIAKIHVAHTVYIESALHPLVVRVLPPLPIDLDPRELGFCQPGPSLLLCFLEVELYESLGAPLGLFFLDGRMPLQGELIQTTADLAREGQGVVLECHLHVLHLFQVDREVHRVWPLSPKHVRFERHRRWQVAGWP
mmetsp:Transcript_72419/g.187907  ORF Transcript_72419/g.187907 Transcript_72419/m.187907 type:complete len:201 (+) Transcript_72419:41-643(+)